MPTYTPPAIPSPPSSSLPEGSSSGNTSFYKFKGGFATGDSLTANDWDNLVNAVDNLTAGALFALGCGVVTGGVHGTATGLSVPVSLCFAILPQSSTRAGYAPGVAPAATLTIADDSTFSVWVVPVTGTDTDGNPIDTVETATAAFAVVTDGTTPDGGLALFSGTSSGGAISGLTDRRTMVGVAGLQAAITALTAQEASDVAAIEAAIGGVYFGGTPPTSVATRLDALEGGGVSTGPTWDALQRTATNPQTIAEAIAAAVGPPVVATPVVLDSDVVVVNSLRALAGLCLVANSDAYIVTSLDADILIPGVTSAALISPASTVTQNYSTHEFQ